MFSPLTEKINIRVLDPFTIKPLDRNLILSSARATKGRILTVEDHYYEGDEPELERQGQTGQGRARATGPQSEGWTSLRPPPQETQIRPTEQLALGLLTGPRLGQGPSKRSCWHGSLEPLPPREPMRILTLPLRVEKVACVPDIVGR